MHPRHPRRYGNTILVDKRSPIQSAIEQPLRITQPADVAVLSNQDGEISLLDPLSPRLRISPRQSAAEAIVVEGAR
jgi:hypothetical protein